MFVSFETLCEFPFLFFVTSANWCFPLLNINAIRCQNHLFCNKVDIWFCYKFHFFSSNMTSEPTDQSFKSHEIQKYVLPTEILYFKVSGRQATNILCQNSYKHWHLKSTLLHFFTTKKWWTSHGIHNGLYFMCIIHNSKYVHVGLKILHW